MPAVKACNTPTGTMVCVLRSVYTVLFCAFSLRALILRLGSPNSGLDRCDDVFDARH